jgi:hypothetical protein
MTMLDMGDGAASPVLFGIARFGGGEVRDVVIPFETSESAESVAVEKGWSDYEVCRLRFFVREASPPADSRRLFDGELARAAERTRGLAAAGSVPAVEPGGEEPAVGLVPWGEGEWAVVVRTGFESGGPVSGVGGDAGGAGVPRTVRGCGRRLGVRDAGG